MLTDHLILEYSPNSVIQNGSTALQQASFNGHYQVVDLLLKAGANPDYTARDEVAAEVWIPRGIGHGRMRRTLGSSPSLWGVAETSAGSPNSGVTVLSPLRRAN